MVKGRRRKVSDPGGLERGVRGASGRFPRGVSLEGFCSLREQSVALLGSGLSERVI